MNLQTLRRDTILFNPKEFGTIFAFVDFGNVRYWAKSFWPDDNRERLVREIDIEKVANAIDLMGAAEKCFYYGHYRVQRNLMPEHPLHAQHQDSLFRIDKAKKAGFKVLTKPIKIIDTFDDAGHHKGHIYKCNFDVEITMNMIRQLPKYDTVFLWSGDSDFQPLLAYLKRKGKKIVTLCARDFASSEIRRVSTLFIPAERLKAQLELTPRKQ